MGIKSRTHQVFAGIALAAAMISAGCASAKETSASGSSVSLSTLPVASTTIGTAGTSQQASAPSPESMLGSLQMITTTTGWAIGGNKLYRTTDSGRNWTDVTPTRASLVTGATLGSGLTQPHNGAFVLDGTTAWVVVGSTGKELLEHTTDGGARWNSEPLPVQPIGNGTYFDFLNANGGWMLINGGVAAGHMSARVYTTADGGASWTETSFVSGLESGSTMPFLGDKSGISILGSTGAWIGGEANAPAVYLLHSSDGGHTWAQQTVRVPQSYSQQQFLNNAPEFFGSTNGILALANSKTVLIFSTKDAGTTWQMDSTVVPSSLQCAKFLVSFVSASDGWVLPREGCGETPATADIEMTTDGGSTWHSVSPSPNVASLLRGGSVVDAIDFVDATHGWMLLATPDQKGRLLYTSDGGTQWAVIPIQVG